MIFIEDNVSPVMQASPRDTTITCTSSNQPTEIQLWLDNHGGHALQMGAVADVAAQLFDPH